MRKLVQCGKYFRSRAVPPYTSFTVYIKRLVGNPEDRYCGELEGE
jgi:hypothetical protein